MFNNCRDEAHENSGKPDRTNPEQIVFDHPLAYWLELARTEAPDSPISVVQNKRHVTPDIDHAARRLAEETYRARFVRVSNHAGRGNGKKRSLPPPSPNGLPACGTRKFQPY